MAEQRQAESVVTPGAAYYVAHGWSGRNESAWSTLTPATREGWNHAAMLAERLEQVEAVEAAMAQRARLAWRSASARGPLADRTALEQHADSMVRWSERLRMALRNALSGDEDWQAHPIIPPGPVEQKPRPTKTSGEPVDLLAALQRSIDAAKSDRRTPPAGGVS